MENKMGKGIDFDFAIYNADTEEGTSSLYSSTRDQWRGRVRSSSWMMGRWFGLTSTK